MKQSPRTTITIIAGIIVVIIVSMIVAFLFLGMGNPRSTQEDGSGFSLFSFFDTNEDSLTDFLSTLTGEGMETTDTALSATTTQPLLLRVFQRPVSGATFINITRTIPTLTADVAASEKTETIPGIRVIERATGNIFDIPLDTLEETRVTNTTIPNIHDSFWSADGSYVFIRSANGTNITGIGLSILLTEEGSGELGKAEALFTHENILDTDMNPSGDTLYILEETLNGSRGILTSINESTANDIFSSAFSEWLVDWAEDTYVYLTTKPSASVPGYLYYTTLTNEELTPLIAGKNGLTTKVNGDGSRVLFSESIDTSLRLSIFSDKKELYMPFDTLPEKCVWDAKDTGVYCGVPFLLPQAAYPDDWYMGNISFNDGFWYTDTETGEGMFLVSPEEYNVQLDTINPVLSSDGSTLLFINKKDMTPWILNIQEAKERINY